MIERILVAVHDRENLGTSLEKAALLEHFTGARVTVAQTCWDWVSEEPAQHFPQEEIDSVTSRMKTAELNNLSASLAHYRQRIAELDAQVLWSKHHAQAIARYALETSTDLIIAPRHNPALLDRVALPEELKLTAHARTPLLIAADRPWPERVNVMAALDVLAEGHDDLNQRLIEFAQRLAKVLDGDLHLVNVDPATTSTAVPLETMDEFRSRSHRTRSDALQTLASQHPYDYAGLHVVAGPVDHALQELASSHEIAIAVVGTAARTGLQRLFVGNTAEILLHHLEDLDLVMIPSTPA